jgi:hypothetical protein
MGVIDATIDVAISEPGLWGPRVEGVSAFSRHDRAKDGDHG